MENFDQILDAPAPSEVRGRYYAGFWIRAGAYIIDMILLVIIKIILLLIIGAPTQTASSLISLIIGFVYFSVQESSERQATLGKLIVGIKVGDSQGRQLTFGNAVGRYFARVLSALLLCIGFMMAGWDPKKQGLHDKLAHTYVFYA